MSPYQELADRLLAALDLAQAPVAVAFPREQMADLTAFEGAVPAGCLFWQEAARRTFITSTKDHELCAIGVHTHHMVQASPQQPAELGEALKAMGGLDYVRDEEVAAIPVLQRQTEYALYGPLAEFPLAPEVVLLFADARQGLVISEAVARVDAGAPPALGRPACAVIPQALNSGKAALSLGCCGARAYLDALPDSAALWALPGDKIDQYSEQIEVLGGANKTLTTFHARRRQDVEAGKIPTVRESLARLAE